MSSNTSVFKPRHNRIVPHVVEAGASVVLRGGIVAVVPGDATFIILRPDDIVGFRAHESVVCMYDIPHPIEVAVPPGPDAKPCLVFQMSMDPRFSFKNDRSYILRMDLPALIANGVIDARVAGIDHARGYRLGSIGRYFGRVKDTYTALVLTPIFRVFVATNLTNEGGSVRYAQEFVPIDDKQYAAFVALTPGMHAVIHKEPIDRDADPNMYVDELKNKSISMRQYVFITNVLEGRARNVSIFTRTSDPDDLSHVLMIELPRENDWPAHVMLGDEKSSGNLSIKSIVGRVNMVQRTIPAPRDDILTLDAAHNNSPDDWLMMRIKAYDLGMRTQLQPEIANTPQPQPQPEIAYTPQLAYHDMRAKQRKILALRMPRTEGAQPSIDNTPIILDARRPRMVGARHMQRKRLSSPPPLVDVDTAVREDVERLEGLMKLIYDQADAATKEFLDRANRAAGYTRE